MTRIEQEGKPEEEFSGLAEALVDWRVWWLGVALHLMLSSMSFTIFFPTISATMGYNASIRKTMMRNTKYYEIDQA